MIVPADLGEHVLQIALTAFSGREGKPQPIDLADHCTTKCD